MAIYEVYWPHRAPSFLVADNEGPKEVAMYIASEMGWDNFDMDKLDKVREGERDGWLVWEDNINEGDPIEFYVN